LDYKQVLVTNNLEKEKAILKAKNLEQQVADVEKLYSEAESKR
jgi:hypothetical protein